MTAADTLTDLDDALLARGIELQFGELKYLVKDKLRRFRLFDRFGSTRGRIALSQCDMEGVIMCLPRSNESSL